MTTARLAMIVGMAGMAPRAASAECRSDPDVLGVSPGAVLAAGHEGSDHGFVLGGEVSVYRLHDADVDCPGPLGGLSIPDYSWLGGYVDAVHDFGNGATRLTLGPEAGAWSVFGVDAGAVLSIRPGTVDAGIALRTVVTFGFVQLFFRYEALFDDRLGANVFEIGLLLKLPHAVKRVN